MKKAGQGLIAALLVIFTAPLSLAETEIKIMAHVGFWGLL